MSRGSVILHFVNLVNRVFQLIDSIVILGIFSYNLGALAHHNLPLARWICAIVGMSAAAALYTLLGTLLACCLGGVALFAYVATVLDACFVGVMIAIAVMTRSGRRPCHGRVDTPLGSGSSDDKTSVGISFGQSCKLNKAVFAVSIVGIALFLVSISFQILLVRHHKREKRFGPSPSNEYTYGSHRRVGWLRRKDKGKVEKTSADDALPSHPAPSDVELGDGEKGAFGSARPYGQRNPAYSAYY